MQDNYENYQFYQSLQFPGQSENDNHWNVVVLTTTDFVKSCHTQGNLALHKGLQDFIRPQSDEVVVNGHLLKFDEVVQIQHDEAMAKQLEEEMQNKAVGTASHPTVFDQETIMDSLFHQNSLSLLPLDPSTLQTCPTPASVLPTPAVVLFLSPCTK